jgi:hypothetical protein
VTLPRTGARLVLRAFTPADAPQAHRRIYGDPDVMRHVGHGPVRDLAATEALLAAYMAPSGRARLRLLGRGGSAPRAPSWATRASSGRCAARSSSATRSPGPSGARGYATEAGELCLAEARELGLRELVGVVDVRNPASVRVLERLGFHPDGERVALRAPPPACCAACSDGPAWDSAAVTAATLAEALRPHVDAGEVPGAVVGVLPRRGRVAAGARQHPAGRRDPR